MDERLITPTRFGLDSEEATRRWMALYDVLKRRDSDATKQARRVDAVAREGLVGLRLDVESLMRTVNALCVANNPERALKLYAVALGEAPRAGLPAVAQIGARLAPGALASLILLAIIGAAWVGTVALAKLVWVSLPF